MKTYLFFLLGFFFLCSSCGKGDGLSTCDTNPAENVDWIKELIAQQADCSDCSLEIIQYSYQDATVFSVDNCIGCSDALINVYDCQENLVCEFGGIAGLNTCPDFETEAVEEAVVYTTRAIEESISKLTFQNSFGSCLGYCVSTIELQDQKLTFTSRDNRGELEPITCEFDLSNEQWQNIQDDLNKKEFFLLDEIIGCPDCADGGASFVDVEFTDGTTKKVTFEFGNPPAVIEDYTSMLQSLLDDANRCEDVVEEEVRGCDKSVVVNNEVFNALSASPIEGVSIEGNCMLVTFSLLSTQNPIEDVDLIDSGLVLESFPIQRSLKLYVKENPTKPSVIQATVSFDIADLATWDAPEVLLNIEGYDKQIKFVRQPQCGDPNVTCLAPTQEQDFKELSFMLNELEVISSIATCETNEDILLTPVGSKACGGPQLFLPYTTSINVDDFLSKVNTYTEAEDFYNRKWNVISTCDITVPPTVICENGKPVLSIATL